MSSTCGVCSELLADGVRCSQCNQNLHFHCASITEKGYRLLGASRQAAWRCFRCRSGEAGASSGGVSPVPEEAVESCNYETLLREIRALSVRLNPLDTLVQDVKKMKSDIITIEASASFAREAVNSLKTRMDAIDQRVIELENIKSEQVDLMQNLQDQIDKINITMLEKEQWDRANNVEIKGIPQSKSENLFDLLYAIGKHIQYPVNKSQVNFITRVQSRDPNHTKPVIVCFNNRYVKEDFVAAARAASKVSPLMPTLIGLQGHQRIFVNDHLTVHYKNLLSRTKTLAKERGFQYVWVKHSKIFARRQDQSPIVSVRTEKDLSKIV